MPHDGIPSTDGRTGALSTFRIASALTADKTRPPGQVVLQEAETIAAFASLRALPVIEALIGGRDFERPGREIVAALKNFFQTAFDPDLNKLSLESAISNLTKKLAGYRDDPADLIDAVIADISASRNFYGMCSLESILGIPMMSPSCLPESWRSDLTTAPNLA